MVGYYLLFSLLPLMGINDEEMIQLMTFQEPSSSRIQTTFQTEIPHATAVFATEVDLPLLSSNVLSSENWLKAHVLVHSPSTRVTGIVVGKGVLCNRNLEHQWSLVLPSIKNLHSSLMRLGLENEIKLSVEFSSDCLELHPFPSKFRGDILEETLEPLLIFLQASNLTYCIDSPAHSSHHQAAIERLGFSRLRVIGMKETPSLKLHSSPSHSSQIQIVLPNQLAEPELPVAGKGEDQKSLAEEASRRHFQL